MNIACAALEGREDHRVDQANHGAESFIASEVIDREVFFLVFLIFGLSGESNCSFVQHALGLLGALEHVVNLCCSGHSNLQLFAQQQSELVSHRQAAGIRKSYRDRAVVSFQWNEGITKHQFSRNAAHQFGVNALLA